MDNNFDKGSLKRWNEDKGFGFIEPDHGKKDIFIHISAFKRRMSRRPIAGDIIIYQVHADNDGKKRAVNAKIEGATEVKPKVMRVRVKRNESHIGLFNILLFISLILLGFLMYKTVTDNKTVSKVIVEPGRVVPLKQKRTVNFRCRGKVYCSEMISCKEATFYQNNCPGTKMDGDGDGVPCESQWCSW